jgi:hypothetical protein
MARTEGSPGIPGPEIPYAGEVPLVPNVRPVIVLQGNDYQMGRQHAAQLLQIFGSYHLAGAAAARHPDAQRKKFKKSESYIKEYTPWAVAYMKGMTDECVDAGISMTYENMLAYFTATTDAPPRPDEGAESEKSGKSAGSDEAENDCSGWAAWGGATRDGKLICGGSGDHEIRVGSKYRYRFEINVVVYPESGYPYVFSPPTGGAGHPGMNNRGVCNVHHGTTGYHDRYVHPERAESGDGVPRTLLLMHALRFARSAEEAAEISISIPNPGGRQGGFWADVGGNALVIENRDNPRVIRRPGDHGERDFLYATNNLFSEELKGCYKAPPGGEVKFLPHAGFLGAKHGPGSMGRNLGLWNLLHNYHGSVDLDFGKMMWRFGGRPLPYESIEQAIDDFDVSQALHWQAHICETGNAMIGICQPDDGNKGVIHVSHGCAARGIDSPTWPGGIVFRLRPTYTFFELALAESPAAVCSSVQTRARYDLWYAYQALMKLTYSDVLFAPLDAILNEAITEWQKGRFYADETREHSGNATVNTWARAIRCYTRCQCYARQVQDALSPPPIKPKDLGLSEWYGDWGEWAIRGDE